MENNERQSCHGELSTRFAQEVNQASLLIHCERIWLSFLLTKKRCMNKFHRKPDFMNRDHFVVSVSSTFNMVPTHTLTHFHYEERKKTIHKIKLR